MAPVIIAVIIIINIFSSLPLSSPCITNQSLLISITIANVYQLKTRIKINKKKNIYVCTLSVRQETSASLAQTLPRLRPRHTRGIRPIIDNLRPLRCLHSETHRTSAGRVFGVGNSVLRSEVIADGRWWLPTSCECFSIPPQQSESDLFFRLVPGDLFPDGLRLVLVQTVTTS